MPIGPDNYPSYFRCPIAKSKDDTSLFAASNLMQGYGLMADGSCVFVDKQGQRWEKGFSFDLKQEAMTADHIELEFL